MRAHVLYAPIFFMPPPCGPRDILATFFIFFGLGGGVLFGIVRLSAEFRLWPIVFVKAHNPLCWRGLIRMHYGQIEPGAGADGITQDLDSSDLDQLVQSLLDSPAGPVPSVFQRGSQSPLSGLDGLVAAALGVGGENEDREQFVQAGGYGFEDAAHGTVQSRCLPSSLLGMVVCRKLLTILSLCLPAMKNGMSVDVGMRLPLSQRMAFPSTDFPFRSWLCVQSDQDRSQDDGDQGEHPGGESPLFLPGRFGRFGWCFRRFGS